MKTANRIGWVVAMFCAIILVSTFIHTSTQDFAAGFNRSVERGKDTRDCDRKKFVHYVGVGQSQVQARQETVVKACWNTGAHKRNPGMVLDKKGFVRVRYYNTGWGDFHGANWVIQQTWRPKWASWDNRFTVTRMRHVGYKQCVSALGQRTCGPTADFSVGAKFTSPYLLKRSDGSVNKWQWVWFKGEPRKNAGSYDDNVWMCTWMCT